MWRRSADVEHVKSIAGPPPEQVSSFTLYHELTNLYKPYNTPYPRYTTLASI